MNNIQIRNKKGKEKKTDQVQRQMETPHSSHFNFSVNIIHNAGKIQHLYARQKNISGQPKYKLNVRKETNNKKKSENANQSLVSCSLFPRRL